MKTAFEQIDSGKELKMVRKADVLKYIPDIEVYCEAHTIGIDTVVCRMLHLMSHTNSGLRKAIRLVKQENPD